MQDQEINVQGHLDAGYEPSPPKPGGNVVGSGMSMKKAPSLWVQFRCPVPTCRAYATRDAYLGAVSCSGVKATIGGTGTAHPKAFMEALAIIKNWDGFGS